MIIECPSCQQHSPTYVEGDFEKLSDGSNPSTLFSLLSCSGCRSPLVVQQTNIGNMAEGDVWDRPILVFPESEHRVSNAAPLAIRTAYEEACRCFQAGAYTATAVMCRKVLEGVADELGFAQRTLAASLEAMRDQSAIDERLYEWSTVLRGMGNAAAHGVGLNVSQEDAKDGLEVTLAILDYLFSFQQRFDAFKARRAAAHNGR